MKKLFFISILILCSGILTAQSLQKGNLIGTHVMTLTLQPGVTQEQFVDFFKNKWVPGIEKEFGWKAYLVKGIRGENSKDLGLIYVIKSEKDRDKFYNADDTQNDTAREIVKRIQPLIDEMGKYASFTTKYTDWVVL